MKYTDLIFDLYGTLLDIHTEKNYTVWEKAAIYFGFYGAQYSGAELEHEFRRTLEAWLAEAGKSEDSFPDIPYEQVMAALFQAKGVRKNADALGFHAAQVFRILCIDYIRLYPNVLEALEKLRQKGYRLWLLSNAQRVFTEYELRHLGLGEQLDGIYLSSDCGCCKPDTRFYHALIEEQNLDPAKCLMIGNDRKTDIAGAKAAGFATLYMHTNLTPRDQTEADPSLQPGQAPAGCKHFEYEGSDWAELVKLLDSICRD